MLSKSVLLALVAAIASPASAYIRFSCGNALIEERADPIVSPGKVAGHVHKIAGGANFGFTMDYDQARASKCSSCPIKQDLSNYWTPKLYYHGQDGSFTSVPTVGDDAKESNGGMTVYYQQRGPDKTKLKAFPPGFRMLAGNAMQRNFTGDFAAQAVTFACLGASQGETNNLPNYNCPQGLRAQIYFPSCWDGVNLDSADHKSHMSYPATGQYNSGTCPPSHPVQLVSLFFEVLYDTNSFSGKWYGGKQPFVFASGDSTGYGFHGDFVNGWDVPTLQTIINTCTDDSKFGSTDKDACAVIDKYTATEMNNCRIPTSIDEEVHGNLAVLPGCNPVTDGPEPAIPNTNCPAGSAVGAKAAVIGQPEQYFTDVTKTKGWQYLGCGSDSTTTRTLTGPNTIYMNVGTTMTVEWCVDWCSSKGYSIAGLEYSTQCYCGNSILAAAAPQDGILGNCRMQCGGDSGEYCGGSLALSLYQKCATGGSCSNAMYTVAGNSTAPAAAAAASPAVVAASSVKPASSSPASSSSTSRASVATGAVKVVSTTPTTSTSKSSSIPTSTKTSTSTTSKPTSSTTKTTSSTLSSASPVKQYRRIYYVKTSSSVKFVKALQTDEAIVYGLSG